LKRLILSLICVLIAGPVSAQSLYGPGGLFLHPAAVFPAVHKLTPSILVLPQGIPSEKGTSTWISGSLDYGARPDLEVGATAVKVTNWGDHRSPSFGGYFKYRVLQETASLPAIAVGATLLGFGHVNTRIGFAALRKRLFSPSSGAIHGDLGLQYADVVDGEGRGDFQPFAGAEIPVTSELTFVMEGRPRLQGENGVPLALTLSERRPDSRYQFSLTWANNGESRSPRFGFGIGLSLGGR